ncbi:alpha/beta hydrolase family protein [Shewanella japonica]|uniref:alpha/beta hydrolase family protein n=1 Tax=Shewanella japonica TaxID=93973 RepID=UPI0024944415|nr:prolyl oligopeptidase family serine peptidase [Shewanella japonica]
MNKAQVKYHCLGLIVTFLSCFACAKQVIQPTDIWSELLTQSTTTQWYSAPNFEITAIMHRVNYPSLATLAQTSKSLAGETFYTSIAGRPDQQLYSHITLINRDQHTTATIRPETGVIVDYNWAPDSSAIALLIQSAMGIRLWNYDIRKQQLSLLSPLDLSTRIGERHLRWLPDSSAIIVKARMGSENIKQQSISQLHISSTEDKAPQSRTYKNLLNTPEKQRHFSLIALSQLLKIDRQGKSQTIGQPGSIYNFAISPDGNYLLIESLPASPSSNLPLKKWGREYLIVNLLTGKHVHQLRKLGDKPNIVNAKDKVAQGARGVQWLPFKPSTISWIEANDHGDMANEQTVHDIAYSLSSPFLQQKTAILQIAWRYYNLIWSRSGIGVLQEWHYQDRQSRTQLLDYHQPKLTTVLSQRDYRDKYSHIGDPMTTRTPAGNLVLLEDQANQIYMKAMGITKERTIPFVDTHNLYTNTKERIFTSKESALEIPLTIYGNTLIISRETTNTPPKYVSLSGEGFSQESLIYDNQNHYKLTTPPQIINYQRQDGLHLQGTLHLPNSNIRNHFKDKKIPAVLWIYPKSFKNKKLSQQPSVVRNRFRKLDPLGPLPLLYDNIAVFESPSMPIIAINDGEPNDQFIEQLIMNAEAAVKALEATGKVDITRLAVMGHSYGAFAVANLLAHTNLFNTGIARSGAYNRTLTPFGFQGEERNLWQATQSYLAMSPFLYADKIDEPLLLVHGEKDMNPGTFPMQSSRMYNALAANKKTAKLVILPHEGHDYRAKENIHQLLIQQSDWLVHWLAKTKIQ